jgi:hypothetical protein
VERLGAFLGLNEETRKVAKPGPIARMMEARSGLPPDAEMAPLPARQKAMKDARRTLTLLVFPVQENGVADTASAAVVAGLVNDAGLCRAIPAPQPAQIEPVAGDPNEMKMLWEMARSVRTWATAAHPDADYLLFADCAFNPRRWEQGFVHFVVCNRQGEWVIVDMLNSEQADYQAIKPTSSTACSRLLVKCLAGYLE